MSSRLESARVKRHVDGVLLLDKPSGISSNRALQVAKILFAAAKAGHTGTLDPMATGLLVICFGEATKFSSLLLSADKTYEATLKLGYVSTTGDAEGEISPTGDILPGNLPLTLPQAGAVLKNFIGRIMQVPPMFSALKHRGKPMYAYAREGVEVERAPREVHIHDLSILALAGNEMRLRIRCGTGTYIRTLADDLGKALGFGGAYLTALRRTALADADLSQAYTLGALEAMALPLRDVCLLPVDTLLQNLPAATLDEAATAVLRQGQTVSVDRAVEGQREGAKSRLYDQEGCFLGLGEIREGRIAPRRLVNRRRF